MNPLKHLPKIRKRDTTKDAFVQYRAIIGNRLSPWFNTKAELFEYVAKEHAARPITYLTMQKMTLESLIS